MNAKKINANGSNNTEEIQEHNKSKTYKIGQDTVLAAGLLELDAGLEVDVP